MRVYGWLPNSTCTMFTTILILKLINKRISMLATQRRLYGWQQSPNITIIIVSLLWPLPIQVVWIIPSPIIRTDIITTGYDSLSVEGTKRFSGLFKLGSSMQIDCDAVPISSNEPALHEHYYLSFYFLRHIKARQDTTSCMTVILILPKLIRLSVRLSVGVFSNNTLILLLVVLFVITGFKQVDV